MIPPFAIFLTVSLSLAFCQFGVNAFCPVCVFGNFAARSIEDKIHCTAGNSKRTVSTHRAAATKNDVVTAKQISSQEELDAHWRDDSKLYRKKNGDIDYSSLIKGVDVIGDTQIIGSTSHKDYTHPVVQLLHERKRANLPHTPGNKGRSDGAKVALAVEGGGMRGCVSAGMICAIHHLNLTDTIDVVYGSSAGTIIGAYLITGQLPWFGPELYYDRLTTAGKSFIDTRRLLRSLGLGLLDPRLLKDVLTRRGNGKPVLNLHYLLKKTVQETKPIDWPKFVERQVVQPLNVVVSGLKSETSLVMNMANGGFSTLEEMTNCMHASCLLPGIAGPVMNLDRRVMNGDVNDSPKQVLGNNMKGDHFEPLADALLFEPFPYQTATKEHGVTHVIVVRSRPDGVDVTGKGGIFEKLIAKRFFKGKNKLPNMYEHMRKHMHKKIYAEGIIEMNEQAWSDRDPKDTSQPHLLSVAVPPGSPEITRLEVGREAIFAGMRRGFARAYDCLVEDPELRGKGEEVAKRMLPDEILDYDPLDIDVIETSAFSEYMKRYGITPKSWEEAEQLYD